MAATGDKDRAVRRMGYAWRWRPATQLPRARDAGVRAPARSAAHGWWLHVRRVEAGRQVAVVGGDDNSAAVVMTGTLSEHAPGAVGTVALGRAPFGAQCCFSNYSNFA
jgi:hypothetical protein